MPILSLDLSCPVDVAVKNVIANNLTVLTNKILGKNAGLTVVKITDAGTYWYVAGEVYENRQVFSLDIKITEKTNDPVEVHAWIGAVYSMLRCELGMKSGAPNYISVTCLDGRFWGYDGTTQTARNAQ
ncbi:hypothetical protein [Pseudomonas fontis]|uniref:4-oxalocrotonate tautomerase n=1 Tax=Pseudomonas fontis TaxID=2942633 RepID=A0ABT5NNR6_9PSED|nr:hypothetical protein [Pseudomonas fontis]MDD0973036.1 hypothetical protein [Pseudomonas fontis]MDD0989805.1 hypothetical protein [Pseudomonas fontis]